MTEEQEFSISQYVDGTLNEAERAEVERLIGADADARALVAEYQAINGGLRSIPMPAVKWDRLAESISAAVEEADERRLAPASFKMADWVRSHVRPLALAASVAIIAGVGVFVFEHNGSATPGATSAGAGGGNVEVAIVAPTPSAGIVSDIVVGPTPEPVAGQAQVEVAVGPGNEEANEPVAVRYSEDLVARPSHVAIASGTVPTSESMPAGYDMQ